MRCTYFYYPLKAWQNLSSWWRSLMNGICMIACTRVMHKKKLLVTVWNKWDRYTCRQATRQFSFNTSYKIWHLEQNGSVKQDISDWIALRRVRWLFLPVTLNFRHNICILHFLKKMWKWHVHLLCLAQPRIKIERCFRFSEYLLVTQNLFIQDHTQPKKQDKERITKKIYFICNVGTHVRVWVEWKH